MTSEWAAAIARWLGFVSAAIACGLVVAPRLLPTPSTPAALARLARVAALGVIAAGAVRLTQQVVAFAADASAYRETVVTLLGMPWGRAWAVQMLVATLVTWRPGVLVDGSRPTRWFVAVALAVAPALQGHAFGSERLMPLAVLADAVHLVAAGTWLGTLFVLAVVLLAPARREGRDVRAVFAAFTPVALGSAAVLVVTGAFGTWLHVHPLGALFTTPYGLALVRKLVVVALIVALGGVNWKFVTPRLSTARGADLLRRTAWGELALAAIAFALTAWLVATPLPGE